MSSVLKIFLPLLAPLLILPHFTTAQIGAQCNSACSFYQINLEGTIWNNKDAATPGEPVSSGDVQEMCADFPSFPVDGSEVGSAVTCYLCGGWPDMTEADYTLLLAWASACYSYDEADPNKNEEAAANAGAECWNTEVCAQLPS